MCIQKYPQAVFIGPVGVLVFILLKFFSSHAKYLAGWFLFSCIISIWLDRIFYPAVADSPQADISC